ncbi:glycosyltransferase family 87 protein [Mesorhizobium sp.]|uniref:glycosyltransferase family 87 protein n=1 Tax=Mesorhizobium sp. TaxID=1871066 RepID=UPI000FE8715B|nr:glycosyltransferase family 87 protein [Mesorhizobium sp.]RWQ61406.1 MAG: DUF2029 domain-containing protein [Mesorhizobium sp.]
MRIADITAGKNLQRLIYLAVCGLIFAYLCVLVIAVLIGDWLFDANGQPIATDFLAFWGAGKFVLQGHAADAYNLEIHKSISSAESGAVFNGYYSWQYPPTFLLVTAALALVSYPAALVSWMAFGITFYAFAIRLIGETRLAVLAAMAWPPVLWNTAVGQNGFVTAALLGAAIASIEKRPALAGLFFGLLTYKPQFGLIIPVALIAGGYWRVIGWATISATAMAVLSIAVFGTQIWSDFFDTAAKINGMILVDGRADFSKLQSLYGFVRALGGSLTAAWVAQGFLIAALSAGIIWIWLQKGAFHVKAAALATATILGSPYAFIYDFVALAVPLVFLGKTGFSAKESAVVIAAGILVGCGPSQYAPTAFFSALLVLSLVIGRALQVYAVPIRPAVSRAGMARAN